MLKVINDTVGSYYYNEKDILTLKDLKSIKQLLLYGRKNDFYYMYNKPKENIYESLLDKLEGPNAEEVLDGTKDKKLEDKNYSIKELEQIYHFPSHTSRETSMSSIPVLL